MSITYDPITLEILWSRLIAIADEVAATLKRTSFSTIVRESNDFACVLLDPQGNSLAQATQSVPSFIGTLPLTTKCFLQKLPPHTLRPGDAIATNDPWQGTGHLPDLSIVAPVFCDGKLVAFVGTCTHLPDIGGRPFSASGNDVFEEGLRIPICKLYSEGKPDEQLFYMIKNNVRVPEQVIGDIEAQMAANRVGQRRLVEFMREEGMTDLTSLSQVIQQTSETAIRNAIRELPDGDYIGETYADGFEEPLHIKVKVSVRGSDILVDYAGTSPQASRGINSVPNYTYAYTVYPLKCILNPTIPNNEGCFNPIKVTAPSGCYLNPIPPAPVGARNLTGHIIPAAIFHAFSDIVPDRILADSGSPCWSILFIGQGVDDRRFSSLLFFNCGQGAGMNKDGGSCLSFPTNISVVPTEIVENLVPVLVRKKTMTTGSGGPGKFRGGCGQDIVIESLSPHPIQVALLTDKVRVEATGMQIGDPGGKGFVKVNGIRVPDPKGMLTLRQGDHLQLRVPGGAGFGRPQDRTRDLVLQDLAERYISLDQARTRYGITVTAEELATKE